MSFFLLYLGEGIRFDPALVVRVAQGIPGTYDFFEGGDDSILQFKYDHAADSTIVRLKRDLETISISEQGDASIMIAVEIQRSLAIPIHMIDEAYSFDYVISAVGSFEKLKAAIIQAQGG